MSKSAAEEVQFEVDYFSFRDRRKTQLPIEKRRLIKTPHWRWYLPSRPKINIGRWHSSKADAENDFIRWCEHRNQDKEFRR